MRGELERYGAGLEERPFLVALNKIDLLPADQSRLPRSWRARLAGDPRVCARRRARRARRSPRATGAGLDGSAARDLPHVRRAERRRVAPTEAADRRARRLSAGRGRRLPVERTGDHTFRIAGPAVERLVGRHDLENRDALEYIEERLRTMGVVSELESKGFEPGDEIEIGEVAFALYPGRAAAE